MSADQSTLEWEIHNYQKEVAALRSVSAELLAACKVALPLLEEWVQGVEHAHEQLRAAIKNAEGQL